MGYVSQTFIPGPRLINGSDLNNLVSQINAAYGPGANYYVNATQGSDSGNNNGVNPSFPLASLDVALALEANVLTKLGLSSVGRGSNINFWGTQHRTKTLAWNLPGTNLVGLCAPIMRGKRARISPDPALAGTAGFNQLVKVTGAGCQFLNLQTFYGFANTAGALINWEDDAGHSYYGNVEFLGFGDGTESTGSSNLTGSRAFKFNSNVGESTWDSCLFGADTEGRGVANFTLEIAGGAPRLHFNNSVFEAYIVSGGTAGSHLLIGAGGIDRYAKFKSCDFFNAYPGTGNSAAMAQAFNISVSAGGNVDFDQCASYGATALQTAPTANALMNMVKETSGGGIALEIN